MSGFLPVFLFIFVVFFDYFVHESEGIRCYTCYGCDVNAGYDINQASVTDCQGSCWKILVEGAVSRGCIYDYTGAEICDAAPSLTACYCNSDLCNTASEKRPHVLYVFLGILLILIAISFS